MRLNLPADSCCQSKAVLGLHMPLYGLCGLLTPWLQHWVLRAYALQHSQPLSHFIEPLVHAQQPLDHVLAQQASVIIQPGWHLDSTCTRCCCG